MSENDIHPWDMLPIDYAGTVLVMTGVGIGLTAAVAQSAWIMLMAAGVSTIGATLKLKGTWYKARIDRERREARGEREDAEG